MAAQKILFRTAIAALGTTLPAGAGAAQNDLVIGATVVSPCAISVISQPRYQPSEPKPVSVDCVLPTQSFVILDDLAKTSPWPASRRDSASEPQDPAEGEAVEIVKIIF